MDRIDRRRMMGWGAASLGAAAAFPSWARTLPAAQPAFQDPAFVEMTPAAEKAIEKGLVWLRKAQLKKGAWGCEPGQDPSAAITGLAGLVLLATGSTPAAGRFTEEINRAVTWAFENQKAGSGLITTGRDFTGIGTFFEHASISMFLTEAYGMSLQAEGNEKMRGGVQKAIDYLDKQQNKDGGWSAEGQGSASDLAVTASVYSSLRSAHNSGLDVSDASVDNLLKFVGRCAQSAGGFGGARGFFYPTGAGLRIMYSQGRQNDAQVMKSAERVIKYTIGSEYGGKISEWDYLAALYSTHAFMLDSSGPMWAKWFPKIREYLVKKQNPDGSWTVEYCMVCRAFATTVALLCLMAPLRTLPMWQL